MASAQIRIDQASNAIPSGTPGKARDDILRAAAVTLRNGDDGGVTRRQWTLLDRPYGSSAVITNPTSAFATIVPDVYGSYRVKLEVNSVAPGEYDIRTFKVRDPAGMALPCSSERADEDNFLVSPGVYNTQGWSREMNERQLRSLDNRKNPLATFLPNGGANNLQIEWGLPMAIIQSLEIVGDSADTDIELYADAAATIQLHLWLNTDVSVGWNMLTPVTVTGLLGEPLENNRIYLKLTNNGGIDSDYQIRYRIKAP